MHPPTLAGRAGRLLVDVLFPARCVLCGRGGDFICRLCERRLLPADPPRCRICWLPSSSSVCHACSLQPPPFEGLRSAFRMEGGARDLVHALKYRGLSALGPVMARLMQDLVVSWSIRSDVVAPVPLHWRRRRSRGYNQSAEMAKELARRLDLRFDRRLLRRVRPAPPQARSAGPEERRRNVEGAFEAQPRAGGLSVLLLDDVATTGATLGACATALREAGAARVWAVTFARED